MDYSKYTEEIVGEHKINCTVFYKSMLRKVGRENRVAEFDVIKGFEKKGYDVNHENLMNYHYWLVRSGKLGNLIYDGESFWLEESIVEVNRYINSLFDWYDEKDTDLGLKNFFKGLMDGLNSYVIKNDKCIKAA